MSIKTIKAIEYVNTKTTKNHWEFTTGEPFEAVDKQIAEGLLEACKKAKSELESIQDLENIFNEHLVDQNIINDLQNAIEVAED
jgi:hypothetical protein